MNATTRPAELTPDEPGMARLIITLAAAGLISGLILASVYQATAPRIAAQQEKRMREAVLKVVPGAASMREMTVRDGTLVSLDAASAGEGAPAPGGGTTGESGAGTIYAALDDAGDVLGYAIPAEGSGFQDVIKLIYGYDPARRRIIGMQVLESRETPGLGDKIYKDPDFGANFDDLAVEPEIVAVKKGTRSAPYEIDAITGATISSKSVVSILNRGNAEWLPRIDRAEAAERRTAEPAEPETSGSPAPPADQEAP